MNYSGKTCLCASGMSMHCDTQVNIMQDIET
jgi:hypothetical protein